MEEDKGYQGWSNYETWDVALWIDNDQGLFNCVHDLGRVHLRNYDFADAIKDLVESLAPELEASMFSDLLNAAISEVDWLELAEHYKKDIEEEDLFAAEKRQKEGGK